MAKKATRTELSSSDFSEDSSSDVQEIRAANGTNKNDSIKNYVTNLLHRHTSDEQPSTDLTQSQITIETRPGHENVSAFRQYHSNAEATPRTEAQQRRIQELTSDEDDSRGRSSAEQSGDVDGSGTEFNLDPNPIIEQRESAEQIYKQKVYLRQLQPPTPQPIEIQVQEVLIQSQKPKPPVHVRVGQREPRTPSPIVIKSAPPQPPSTETDQPIIYNKYVPPPKQPPQQIIIHRYPDLPPKPRPIVVEQWLPYKPAPKRIIKHSLPPEALQTPPPPHNLLVSYAKPRALIEVELVRLPVVKIDPQTYQQMSAASPQRLAQHPSFQHEQDYLSQYRSGQAPPLSTQLDWRI